MESFSDVIRALGEPPGFAKAVGVAESHARTMKARDSIPPEYWQALVAAAEARGIEGVSLDLLAGFAARRRRAVASAAALSPTP